MPAPLTDITTLSHQLIEFYEKISSWEQAVVRGTGLSPAQMHAIEIVGHGAPLRMKELAEKIGVTTGSLTVMIDRLERQGLLRRQPHATDRRSCLIALTEKGERLFGEHHHYHLRLTQEITSSLSQEEQELFSGLLGRVLHRM